MTPLIRPTALAKGLTALAVVALSVGLGGPAAARPRPVPRPAPAPAPAIVSNIVIDEANQGSFRVNNADEFGVEYIVKVVGPPPVEPIPDFPGRTVNGYVAGTEGRLTGLLPSTPYTVTVLRHRFYDARTYRAVSVLSAPTSFSFTTPSLAATRPSAPVIRITGPLGTGVALAWTASTDNVSAETQLQYTYAVAGDPFRTGVPTCSSYCFGQTGTFIQKPPSGTSISVTVTAVDAAGLRSLPSNAVTITA
jgi:hypothetical protein